MRTLGLTLLWLGMGLISQAFAADYRYVSSVFQASKDGKTYSCAVIDGVTLAGTLNKTDPNLFLSFKAQIRALKLQIAAASGARKSKLQNKLATITTKSKAGTAACRAGGGNPPPQLGNFDLNGNVTPQGKVLFGIPSGLTANIFAGKLVLQANCGCHEERTGRSFSNLRENTRRFPMGYDEVSLPDAALANLTAYLNRFRQ
ncbi:MAG: hypothetical protein K1X83_06775 [Oligoflexia bacterium]|nr:hypothetical protein [Oligoflexia bacterium]